MKQIKEKTRITRIKSFIKKCKFFREAKYFKNNLVMTIVMALAFDLDH